MRKALVLTVLLLASTCFADSLFEIEGTLMSPFTDNRVGTFAGTIEINATTGSIVSWYIAMPSIPPGFEEPGIDGFTFTPANSTAFF